MAEAAEKFNRDKIFLHRKAREMLGHEITPKALKSHFCYIGILTITGTIISANTWFLFYFIFLKS